MRVRYAFSYFAPTIGNLEIRAGGKFFRTAKNEFKGSPFINSQRPMHSWLPHKTKTGLYVTHTVANALWKIFNVNLGSVEKMVIFFENRNRLYPTQFSTLYRMVLFLSLYDIVEKRFVRNIKNLSLVFSSKDGDISTTVDRRTFSLGFSESSHRN